MNTNNNLNKAKKEANDEFYTQLSDIERELAHYKQHFKGKTIYCNCDDPVESNFVKYFILQFKTLKIKKLIATCYGQSKIAGTQYTIFDDYGKGIAPKQGRKAYKTVITEDMIDDDFTMEDVNKLLKRKGVVTRLDGDGDFASDECISLLKESDIVVTNPPFSKFREYIAQLMEYDKKFVIIGHQNAIGYKEIFPLIRDNKVWLGYGFKGGAAHFINSHYTDYAKAGDHKEGMIRVSGVVWFTNISTKKRQETIDLYQRYNPTDYPKYDNYDAIEVSKTNDIPCDYDGVMGVPITFIDKYNPNQFDIIALMSGAKGDCLVNGNDGNAKFTVNGKQTYSRILIRRK